MVIQYGRQSISESDIDAVAKVLKSDWLTIGPEVTNFENRIASVADSKYSVAVSSGTAALHCAYKALKINPGDEVITTPLTFVATAAMAALSGAKVLFADISEDTGNIDPESVRSLVSNKTKVISGVDFAGHPIEIDELLEISKQSGAYLLEDAAHSIGGSYKGKAVGSQADITTFSFFPTKNLTTGEGGAVVSNSEELYIRAKKFKMHGLVREQQDMRYPDEGPWHQEVHEFGLNYRLPDILATLGSSQLLRLKEFKARRTEIFKIYVAELSEIDWITLPTWKEYVDPMWHLFPIRVPAYIRRSLVEYLRKHEVMVQVNYIPVYWHPVFEDMGYKRGICPQAEQYYLEEISIPIHPNLTESELEIVIKLLKNFKFKS